jgi:hypothetical protein
MTTTTLRDIGRAIESIKRAVIDDLMAAAAWKCPGCGVVGGKHRSMCGHMGEKPDRRWTVDAENACAALVGAEVQRLESEIEELRRQLLAAVGGVGRSGKTTVELLEEQLRYSLANAAAKERLIEDLRPVADHAALLGSENDALRNRVESQVLVIADLRHEVELACRRIVELERGEDDGS